MKLIKVYYLLKKFKKNNRCVLILNRAIIRADGNRIIGMGHLTRNIELANELQNNNYEVYFLTKDFVEGISLLKENNFKILKLKKQNLNLKDSITEINRILDEFGKKINLIIIDILKFFDNQEYLDNLKAYCDKLIILTDHTSPFYIKADTVFAFSQNQNLDFYKDVKKTKYFTGLKFFPLKRKFQNIPLKMIKKEVKQILITFGGSDPKNYSARLNKLLKNVKFNAAITIIIGAGYSNTNFKNLIENKTPNLIIKRNVEDIINYFKETDICICSAGNTLVELLTCGVPCVVLPQTERENEHAKEFERKKNIINLGLNFSDNKLISELKKLMLDYSKRKILSENAQNYLDGQGLKRMMDIILKEDL